MKRILFLFLLLLPVLLLAYTRVTSSAPILTQFNFKNSTASKQPLLKKSPTLSKVRFH